MFGIASPATDAALAAKKCRRGMIIDEFDGPFGVFFPI
jgi:hypothetical protein